MLPLSRWHTQVDWLARPWLVVGKGPSAALLDKFDLRPYFLLSLNHAVREIKADVAHFIDLEAIEASADAIRQNADWLLVARYPHRNFAHTGKPLEQWFDQVPVLREFSERGRLVWYYHSQGPQPAQDREPRIRVDYCSAEAALGVLATLGVRTVRLLGVDGGMQYSQRFQDLAGVTCLANGLPNFNRQFVGINRLAKEHDMDIGPLLEPIRVFVGADEKALVPTKVLEYSIRKFASRPVEVTPMLGHPIPEPKDPENRSPTGFSFQRFLIPKLAGYQGKAIYLDSDMLVFSDIAELFDLPMNDKRVLCSNQQAPEAWRDYQRFHPGRQYSVLLLDCGRLDWDVAAIVRGLNEKRFTYRQLMFELCLAPEHEVGDTVPQEWNSLERFEAGRTRLLHYTVGVEQPWVYRDNPLGPIWRAFYREALAEGAVPPELVEAGIAKGHLLPELADDLWRAPNRRPAGSLAETPLEGVASMRLRAQHLSHLAAQAEAEILREQLTQARHQLTQVQAQMQARLVEQQAFINGLQHSLSWKLGRGLTKPLRAVRRLLALTRGHAGRIPS